MKAMENPDFAKLYDGKQHNFKWLMEHLLAPNDKFKSCLIRFPDTVFYKEGFPKYIIKNDEDGFLEQINNPTKL
jgi:hypothetical protein